MARFSRNITENKKFHAKDLYVKGFEYSVIADILGVSEATVRKWGKELDYESARQASYIALSELRNTILQSFIDLKSGKVPKIKPDEAAKYASAFEKLSDKRKTLTYMYEAYEMLSAELMLDIQHAKNTADKEKALTTLKHVRTKTDAVINRLNSEVDD